jgi:hypothetical protein
MNVKQVLIALTTGATFAVVVGAGSLSGMSRAQADDEADAEQARIRRGFEIAPVPLNLQGKDRQLVGLGSYLVNGVGHCNVCHSAGPATEYAKGGNPYFSCRPSMNISAPFPVSRGLLQVCCTTTAFEAAAGSPASPGFLRRRGAISRGARYCRGSTENFQRAVGLFHRA